MAVDSKGQIVVVSAVFASLCFLVIGFAVQDWGGGYAPRTGGEKDSTWGTWVTAYTLAIESLVFALNAPPGPAQGRTYIAFLFQYLAWTAVALLHQYFPVPPAGKPWSTSFLSLDPMSIHLALRIISAVALVLAGCFIACAAQTLVREMGACGGRKGGGCCTCLFVMVGLVLSGAAGVAHLMPPQTFVPQWVLIAIPQGGSLMAAFIACGSGACTSCAAMLCTFVLGVVILLVAPTPFVMSPNFNETGLAHAAYMLYLAAIMGLIADLSAGVEDYKDEEFAQSLDRMRLEQMEASARLEERMALKAVNMDGPMCGCGFPA